jgi:SH3-like domain-containing protein
MIERKEIKKETPLKQAVNYIKIDPIGSSLNIRSGPAATYAVVASGAPGTEYEMLEEKNGWIKIRIVPEKEAWVNANFVKKIVK